GAHPARDGRLSRGRRARSDRQGRSGSGTAVARRARPAHDDRTPAAGRGPMMSSRQWLIPEVVQTSAMDCGPAALKAMLEGFGIPASYGRLREACQTDVDGTSINAIEDAAVEL